jgi:hypothetical protein
MSYQQNFVFVISPLERNLSLLLIIKDFSVTLFLRNDTFS